MKIYITVPHNPATVPHPPVLEEVIKEHPVLLNRAPTLHRLGIQAFEPVLTEGRALKLHPLACTAYNADFDGDQMAIHLPLSAEAQAEARVLMLAANHILAPKDGKPIIVPTQDMVLGTYYLTKPCRDKPERRVKGEGKYFTSFEEALLAYDSKELDLQAEIIVRQRVDRLPDFVLEQLSDDEEFIMVKTSVGRMIFNEKLPPELRHYHRKDGNWILGEVMNKKALGSLVAACYNKFGATRTAEVIDSVKRLGYHYACIAGMTVAISDVIVPPQKKDILADTAQKVKRVEMYYTRGILTEKERYDKVCALWSDATEKVADAMMANMDEFNPIFMMSDSGARGNKQQMRQLAGMRGLMADPSGKIIDLPITANFREGLSVSDYFISSHGARKGLADTALRTADSGYLTRRLVDVAQDVIVREDDCDVVRVNLLLTRALLAEDTFDALEILSEVLTGRILAKDIINPETGEIALSAGSVLDEDALIKLGESSATELTLRGCTLTLSHGATETIKLGTPSESERATLRHAFIHEHLGKELVGSTGAILTHEMLEELLDDELVTEILVRQNNIRGIEVEAIVENRNEELSALQIVDGYLTAAQENTRGVIEPLSERIIGRVLAENIYDKHGELIAGVNDTIDDTLAEKICASLADRHRIKVAVNDSVVVADEDFYSKDGKLIIKSGDELDNAANLLTEPVVVADEDFYSKDGKQIIKSGDELDNTANLLTEPVVVADEDFYSKDGKQIIKSGDELDNTANLLTEPVVVADEDFYSKDGKQIIKSGDELDNTANLLTEPVVVADEDFYSKDGKLIIKSGEQLLTPNSKLQTVTNSKLQTELTAPDKVLIRSVLTCKSSQGVCKKCYGQDLANRCEVEVGEAVGIIAAQSIGEPGTQLTMRTFHTGGVAGGDITQGLPRVEELFEARKPKMSAIISEISGTVSIGKSEKNDLKVVIVTPSDSNNQQPREYTIPFGITPRVHEGDTVQAGDQITEGPKNPHDILRICGLKETHRYLVKEVQKVYKSQGVEINDKHIEVMVRQMLHKVTSSFGRNRDGI